MDKSSIDLVKLSEFAYNLENCHENLNALGYLNELDNQASLKQIINKLPKFLQNRWRTENQTIKEAGEDVRLKDAVRFVKKAAAEASDPVFGEMGNPKNDKKQAFPSRRIQVNQTNAVTSQRPNKCWVCNNNEHWTDQCHKFKEMSVSNRYELCKSNHVCFSCLRIAGQNHRQDSCNRKKQCGETSGPCLKYHHKMLHAGERVQACFTGVANLECLQEPMLRLVDVEVIIDGKAHWANVLLDNGSQGTFVRKGFAKGLKGKNVTATITTVGGAESVVNSKVLILKLRSNNGIENVTALMMDDITEAKEIPDAELRHIEAAFGLQKASLRRRGGKVDMLIGNNHPKLHTGEMLESDNMVVQKSPFGWTVMGGKVTNDNHNNSVMHVKIHEAVDLTEFWTTESMGVNLKTCECKPRDIDEELEGKLIQESCMKVGEQWLIPYPWAQGPTGLMDNRYQAERMLIGLEKRLMKNTERAKAYDQQMSEMLELAFARKLELEEMSDYKGPVHYIPHHSVLKKGSTSTPLRIVFNSSNKHNGQSLNDYWMKGPDMLNNIQGVIMRFREHKVALWGTSQRCIIEY
ncbi:uncharacterized protein LOC117111808 [Anneissia japonica]|uniref:uncharacterized protein LOC117111808 n=1 Tax=Anneissia japonica TaxID=1529436 RepID=UPI001425B7F4|nr:uncharacterized protein LOC117111808 [Anneissia japonica]